MNTRPQPGADSDLEQGFRIGELRVDPQAGEVTGPGSTRQLDPKVMAVLVYMAKRAGHVITREEFLAALWPGAVVSDDALARCFYELRRELSLAGGSDEFRVLIETLPKRGHRLNGEVQPAPPPGPSPPVLRRPSTWLAAGLVAVLIAIVGYLILAPPEPKQLAVATSYSIAVLPFVDMSENKDQRYFSDGTTEEILNRLSQSPNLRVISRTSSFTFRDTPYDVPEIARRLNVTHVLEGSVRKSGDRVRVTAQLIAASDGSHVWSDTFDRRLGDVFAIQDEVAAAVATALATTLTGRNSSARPPANLKAYDLVLQGEYFYWRRAPGDVELATRLFEQAVKVDPAYARAWAALSAAYGLESWNVDPPSAILRAKQGEAALRAVSIDPASGIAHRRLGQYYEDVGDAENRDKHSALAQRLDPSNPLMISDRAWGALAAGRYDEALALQRDSLLRDPLNNASRQNLGVMQLAAGKYDESLATYRTLLEMNPQANLDTRADVARILVLLGRFDGAAMEVMRLPAGKYRDQALALLASSPAHRDEADAALRRLERNVPKPQDTREMRVMDALRLAEIYAYRGRHDAALATLTNMKDEFAGQPDSRSYLWMLRNESSLSPFLKPLHADPRWRQLMVEPLAVKS